ncbi:hypothetical protein FRC05_006877 [Tulasnella sp. 425]|nr:hypothetical protein FRC05_006877 [Tulasnella sp. 425]
MSSSETRYCEFCDKKIVVWHSTPNGDFNWKQHLRSSGHQAKVARSAKETNIDTRYSEQPPQPAYAEPLPVPTPPQLPQSEAHRPPAFKPFSQQAAWVSQENSAPHRPTADRLFSPPNGPPPPSSQPPVNQPPAPPMSNQNSNYLPTPQVHPSGYLRSPPNSR